MWDLEAHGGSAKASARTMRLAEARLERHAPVAEAYPPKLRNIVEYRVEEYPPNLPFWKHRAAKMRLVEAQCAHRKHCYPEIPLGSHPTSRVSQLHKAKNSCVFVEPLVISMAGAGEIPKLACRKLNKATPLLGGTETWERNV